MRRIRPPRRRPVARSSRLQPGGGPPAALLFLVLLGVILVVQNPGLMADDSGEIVTAAVTLGVPHPPGYPFPVLLGHWAAQVPVGTPAFRLNLLSGLFNAAAAAGIALLAWRLSGVWGGLRGSVPRILIALGAGFSLLSCANVFAQGLTAKGMVYTLTLLLVVGMIGSLERAAGLPGRAEALGGFAFFLWGAGLAGHWPTILLTAPFLIFGSPAWLRGGTARILRLATFLLIPLSLYLYLPLRASWMPDLDWGHPNRWDRFGWALARGPYAGIESEGQPFSSFMGKGLAVWRLLWTTSWPGWIVLSLAGMAGLARSHRRQAVAWALAFLVPLAGIVVVPRLETGYLLGIYLSACMVPLALGAHYAAHSLLRLVDRPGRGRAALLVAGLVALIPAIWLFRTTRVENRARYLLQEDYGTHLLRNLPRGAFLLAEGDVNAFPLLYHRLCLGRRPDIGMIPFVFLNHDWGWQQVERQRPAWAARRPGNLLDRLGYIRALCYERQELLPYPEGQELFYTLDTTYLDAAVPGFRDILRPFGLVQAITARTEDTLRTSDRVLRWSNAWRERDPGGWPEGDVMSASILKRYADSHAVVADRLFAAGNAERALLHLDRAMSLYPRDPRVYVNMVLILGQEGWWELAREVARQGSALAPPSASLQMALGGICLLLGDYDGAYSAFASALRLRPGWKEAQDQLQTTMGMQQTGFQTGPSPKSEQERALLPRLLEERGCRYLAGLARELSGEGP